MKKKVMVCVLILVTLLFATVVLGAKGAPGWAKKSTCGLPPGLCKFVPDDNLITPMGSEKPGPIIPFL